jgi:acetyl esterase/lipase
VNPQSDQLDEMDSNELAGPDEIVALEKRVDPETAAAVRRRGVDLRDIPRARAAYQASRAAQIAETSPNPAVRREDITIPSFNGGPSVNVRRYAPLDQAEGSPCLLWIHGGGHVLGEMELDDPLAESFVDTARCVVVSVEWRKSPEHPFPAAIHDCYSALLWLHRSSGPLRIDPDRVAIGGASSGGGSAAGLALLTRDRGEVPICYQLLTYPMLDDRNITPSSYAITHPGLWNRVHNVLAWNAYLGTSADNVSPYAAPTRASELSGLAPAFVAVGELDLFLDEDIEYAQRLLQAGVPTELHVYPGAIHGFDRLAPASLVARRLVRDRSDALARAFRVGSLEP